MDTDLFNVLFDQVKDYTGEKPAEVTVGEPATPPVQPEEVVVQPAKDTSPEVPANTPSPDVDNSSIHAALAKVLAEERGLPLSFDESKFLEREKEVGGAKALIEFIEGSISEYQQSIKGEYDEYAKEYVALREQGVDENEARTLVRSWEEYDNLDLGTIDDNEELARNILYQHYKETTSFSDAKIQKEISKKEDFGSLIEDSKEAAEEMKQIARVKIEESKKALAAQAKAFQDENKKQVENVKKSIQETKELWGITLNETMHNKMIDMLVKPAGQDANGNLLNALWMERSKDPITFDKKLALLKITGAWDDISKLTGKTTTKAFEQLERTIEKSREQFSKGSPRLPNAPTEDTLKRISETFFKG